MLRFLGKRLFQGIFVLIGVSILIFIISRIVPGNPARLALGPRATQEAVDALSKEMHLDESLPKQYYHWISGVVKGDFGKSVNTMRPVADDVKEFFPATIELVLFSGIILVILSVVLGLLGARYQDTWVDGIIRLLSYVGIAIPSFVIAIIFLLIFGNIWKVIPVLGRLSYGVTPPPTVTGMILVDSIIAGNWNAFADGFLHLLLPGIALSLIGSMQGARILRSSLIDNKNKEHISVLRGYGLPEKLLTQKFLLKPSLTPVITIIGLSLANLMGNAFLVERIFNWPGLSSYGVNAMLTKDLNAISAVILIAGLVFLIVNILVDIILAALDPRIRLGDE